MSTATERTPLNKPPSPPLAYTYLPQEEDDGREVEVWRPGKSTFNQTVSWSAVVLFTTPSVQAGVCAESMRDQHNMVSAHDCPAENLLHS